MEQSMKGPRECQFSPFKTIGTTNFFKSLIQYKDVQALHYNDIANFSNYSLEFEIRTKDPKGTLAL
jgi:hypothetical protein